MYSIQDFYNKYFNNELSMDEYINYLHELSFNLSKTNNADIKYLDQIVKDLKKSDTLQNELIDLLEILYVQIKNPNKLDSFINLKKINIYNYTDTDIINYFTILLKSAPNMLNYDKIDFFITLCINKFNHIAPLLTALTISKTFYPQKMLKTLYNYITTKYINIFEYDLNYFIFQNKHTNILNYLDGLNELKDEYLILKILILIKNKLNYIKYTDHIIENITDQEYLEQIKTKVNNVYQNTINKGDNNTILKEKVMSGKINFELGYPQIKNINYPSFDVPIINEKIITIDDISTHDLDGGFSINKKGNLYDFKVYISDVPSFLSQNSNLAKIAYERACSIYLNHIDTSVSIDMLPRKLSFGTLSLQTGCLKNVIVFNFIVDEKGIIYKREVSRAKVNVTKRLSPKETLRILKKEDSTTWLDKKIKLYKEFCQIIIKNATHPYLKKLHINEINDLVGLPSILINYFIGEEADFTIYRENGKYTINPESYYTHSTTPLRRIVSNINLAFFLEQKGVMHFNDKDLYLAQKNIKHIIDHINNKDALAKFAEHNASIVLKYVKK